MQHYSPAGAGVGAAVACAPDGPESAAFSGGRHLNDKKGINRNAGAAQRGAGAERGARGEPVGRVAVGLGPVGAVLARRPDEPEPAFRAAGVPV